MDGVTDDQGCARPRKKRLVRRPSDDRGADRARRRGEVWCSTAGGAAGWPPREAEAATGRGGPAKAVRGPAALRPTLGVPKGEPSEETSVLPRPGKSNRHPVGATSQLWQIPLGWLWMGGWGWGSFGIARYRWQRRPFRATVAE